MGQPHEHIVLVVDDEPKLRAILVEELEMEGYKVMEAENGIQAFEIVQTDINIDVIISDVRMPEASGIEMLKKIVASGRQRPKVFLVSGYADLNREMCIAQGAVDLLTKPYQIEHILKAVKDTVEGLKVSV